uniref:Uncharacterized protein n=1 Tax=Davidia involucrata TaxID=16924 RepID=A0A5B6YV14_DAVIN
MKAFGFWFLLSVVGTTLLFLAFSTEGSTASLPDMAFTRHGNGMAMTTTSRKLKDNGYTSSTDMTDAGNENLEDYHPIDPVPSWKASIEHEPIQHGAPLNPNFPKPSPPGHRKHGGFP